MTIKKTIVFLLALLSTLMLMGAGGVTSRSTRESLSAMARDGSDGTAAAITALGGLSSGTIRAEIDADVATVAGDLSAHSNAVTAVHGAAAGTRFLTASETIPVTSLSGVASLGANTFVGSQAINLPGTDGLSHIVLTGYSLATGTVTPLETIVGPLTTQAAHLEIFDITNFYTASFLIRGGSNEAFEEVDVGNHHSVASGTAASMNICVDGDGTYSIQNSRGNAYINLRYFGRK